MFVCNFYTIKISELFNNLINHNYNLRTIKKIYAFLKMH